MSPKKNSNQQEQAMEDLLDAQKTLGDLGFTMNSSGSYYKDYGLVSGGSVRITPVFDKGLYNDKSYVLSAIVVQDNKTVALEPGKPAPLHEFPAECRDDISIMLIRLVPEIVTGAKKAEHIITGNCIHCDQVVASFVCVKGEVNCMKCLME